MATFQTSTFGRMYVTSEGLTELPLIRLVFVGVTALLGAVLLLKLLFFQFWTMRSSISSKVRDTNVKRNRGRDDGELKGNLGWPLFVLYFISYTIHVIHYADNIYRPVAYFEPKWLYVKYVLSEMELTFFANFPISIIGYINIVNLLTALRANQVTSATAASVRGACKRLIFYVLGSLLTLGHYRTEPPTKYSLWVNFTIAGEGIVTILFAIVLWVTWRRAKASDRSSSGLPDHFIAANNPSGNQEIENLLEQEEHDMNVRRESGSGTRRRSKTPIA